MVRTISDGEVVGPTSTTGDRCALLARPWAEEKRKHEKLTHCGWTEGACSLCYLEFQHILSGTSEKSLLVLEERVRSEAWRELPDLPRFPQLRGFDDDEVDDYAEDVDNESRVLRKMMRIQLF